MYRLIVLSVSLLCLISCDPARVYETNKDFEDTNWLAWDTAAFSFTITDTAANYNVWLNLRNSIDFETARIFLNFQLLDSSAAPIRKRLIEQTLFDKKTGQPFGDSGLGDIYSHQFLIESNMSFPSSGTFQVKLNQMMRSDTLQEVLSVGIRVEKAGIK
jgi:gliding motility-associated lipoprotein GldH